MLDNQAFTISQLKTMQQHTFTCSTGLDSTRRSQDFAVFFDHINNSLLLLKV